MRARFCGRAIVTVCIIIASLVLYILVSSGFLNGDFGSPAVERTLPPPARNPEFEKSLQDAIASGAIHSIDVESARVRISPEIWCGQNIEQKQQSLLVFSAYFKSLGKSGRVEILSDRNDTVFATYSVSNGAKILY